MADMAKNVVPHEFFTKRYHHKPYPFISPKRPELSAAGKNVIVTGGGTGIGKAIATAFAQAGAKSVAIIGRRENILEAALRDISAAASDHQTEFLYRVADLTVEAEASAAIASIGSRVGPIHIFVSNAGSVPALAPVTEYGAKELLRAFELNVTTCLHAVRAFKPVAATVSPVFVNISSCMAHASPLPAIGISAYSASKAANLKMIDYFAAENPHYHVVNVQPGIVATEMADNSELNANINQDEPDLAGQFCVWLASPEASFLKSKFVWANWDAEEMVERAEDIKKSDKLTCVLNVGLK